MKGFDNICEKIIFIMTIYTGWLTILSFSYSVKDHVIFSHKPYQKAWLVRKLQATISKGSEYETYKQYIYIAMRLDTQILVATLEYYGKQ